MFRDIRVSIPRPLNAIDELRNQFATVDLRFAEKQLGAPIQLTTEAENRALRLKRYDAHEWLDATPGTSREFHESYGALLRHRALTSTSLPTYALIDWPSYGDLDWNNGNRRRDLDLTE